MSTATLTINEIKSQNSEFRTALAWVDGRLSELSDDYSIEFTGENDGIYCLTATIDGEIFKISLECSDSPDDRWILSDENNEVIEQITKFENSVLYGSTIAQEKQDVRDEKRRSFSELHEHIKQYCDNSGKDGLIAFWDALDDSTVKEIDNKGDERFVIDPSKLYGKLYTNRLSGLIDPNSEESRERQFSKSVLSLVHNYILPAFHTNLMTTKAKREGVIFAYSIGDGPKAHGRKVGVALMRQPSAKKLAPSLQALVNMC